MKRNAVRIFLIVCIWLALVACSASISLPLGTPTPADTATPMLTATNTPWPTYTATPPPTIKLGPEQVIPAGAYSFQTIFGYDMQFEGPVAALQNPGDTIIFTIIGTTENPFIFTPEELTRMILDGWFEETNGNYELGEAHAIVIDGVEGVAFDLTGVMSSQSFEGQAAVAIPKARQFIFVLGMAYTRWDTLAWVNEGGPAFNALLSSIRFLSPEDIGKCQISLDRTYGYSPNNPIKVGGSWSSGPQRTRTYLDTLRGPNGEQVIYKRLGSLTQGDVILDKYEVTYSGKTVILYVDIYEFKTLFAPAGFTCPYPFMLNEP